MNKIYVETSVRKCKLRTIESGKFSCGGKERKDIESGINMSSIIEHGLTFTENVQNPFHLPQCIHQNVDACIHGPMQNEQVCHGHVPPLSRSRRRDPYPMLRVSRAP